MMRKNTVTLEATPSVLPFTNGHSPNINELIPQIIEKDDPSQAYGLAYIFATLPTDKYTVYKSQLKEHFKRRFNIRELDAMVKEIRKKLQKEKKEAFLDHSTFPSIIVSNRQLRDIADESLKIAYEANNPPVLFVRSGSLTRIVQGKDKTESPRIEPLNMDALRARLTRVANFYADNGEFYTDTFPPRTVCENILARGTWDFPPLDGIIQTPIVREDGTILDTPGYDPLTRLYYIPGDDFPKVSENPTEVDIEEAKEIFEDVIGEFAFETNADKTTQLAAIMTPMLRTITGKNRPIFGEDAPRQGTGKTYLAKIPGIVATGEEPHVWSETTEEEEQRKRNITVLQGNDPVFIMDNLTKMLDSPSLNAMTTSEWYQDRGMATQKAIRYRNMTTVIVAGNNLRVGTDTERRYIPIRLNAKVERPWERKGFKHKDIIEHTKEVRPKMVWAVLALARNWFVKGCPSPSVTPLGSFEKWTTVIGGILEIAGYTDFLGRLKEGNRQVNEEMVEWEDFLSSWYKAYGSQGVTVKQLVSDLQSSGDSTKQEILDLREMVPAYLEDLLFNPYKKGDAKKKLGGALSKRRDMVVGDYSLTQGKKLHNAVTYIVQCNEPITPGDGSTPPSELADTSQQDVQESSNNHIEVLAPINPDCPKEYQRLFARYEASMPISSMQEVLWYVPNSGYPKESLKPQDHIFRMLSLLRSEDNTKVYAAIDAMKQRLGIDSQKVK